jgi:hypothetical protein
MYNYKVRYRFPNGGWGETILSARNNYEATQQAYAIYGQAAVMAVWQDNY